MTVECQICGREFDNPYSLGSHKAAGHDDPWKDSDRLHKEYVEKGKTTYELADEWGCDSTNIQHWLEKHGIEKRQTGDWQEQGYASYFCEEDGYMRWMDYSKPSRGKSIQVHRLLAVAEIGIDEVKGKVVHHRNGVKWDNRPENLELTTNSDHAKRHYEMGDLELEPGGIRKAVAELKRGEE